MAQEQLNELLYQALETDLEGIEIYSTAVSCAVSQALKNEWEDDLMRTCKHERLARAALKKRGLDPNRETPGRSVVRHVGKSLVEAMEMAKQKGDSRAAEMVATECVVLAATNEDQLNWALLGEATNASLTEMASR